jgi:hypothetical protein
MDVVGRGESRWRVGAVYGCWEMERRRWRIRVQRGGVNAMSTRGSRCASWVGGSGVGGAAVQPANSHRVESLTLIGKIFERSSKMIRGLQRSRPMTFSLTYPDR